MGRYYQTQQFNYTREALDAILTAFKTNPAAALFPTLKLQLGQSAGFAWSPDTTLAEAQAQEADFTDYVEASITLGDPVNVSADALGALGVGNFIMTTNPPVTTNLIYNYWVYSGTLLVGGESFAGGVNIPMANVGDFLQIDLQLPLLFTQPAI